ncbi:MAG TPA: hypothetical protein VKZ85_02905 [Woeseiaceae bacterium]|nr:hypothetical protein [Woeseiaceae bacterium]
MTSSANDALEKLLANPRIWRGGSAMRNLDREGAGAGIPTGYAALDRHLPGGGWPREALMEVLVEGHGRGELRLLMPALARLSRAHDGHGDAGWITWIAPPLQPYPPALAQWGMDLSRVLVVRPRRQADVLWAAEQALASGNCAAVLFWPERTGGARAGDGHRARSRGRGPQAKASPFPSRRLQLAAEQGGSLGVAFRPASARFEISAAALRLALTRGEHETEVVILKSRGGRPVRVPGVFQFHA